MAGGGLVVGGGSNGEISPEYPFKLTWYVILTAIAAAMGGLIFGYDIGISGGVTSMNSFLQKFFPSVYRKESGITSTNQYCKFDSQLLTLFTSSLYLAALVSSFVASGLTKRYGRKTTMLVGSLVFLVGAGLNAGAVHVSMLIVGRILLGVGVGFANQSVPIYLSEVTPPKLRGRFNVCFQLFITIGILAANMVNYLTGKYMPDEGWRVSLGLAAVPAILMLIPTLFFLKDSPNSLLERGKKDKAKEHLKLVRGVDNVDEEFSDILRASEESKRVKNPWRNYLKEKKYRPQFYMSIAIPVLQQFTGINVVMFYAPVLFKTLGFGSNASLMSALITGIVNVAATFISVYGTDKWGRRPLFIIGGIVMIIFQGLVAILIGIKFGWSGEVNSLPTSYAIGVVICMCVFVSAFACSWGPLGWLVPSEIFPLEIRSAAQSVTVAVNMLCTFIIAEVFLKMLCSMKFFLFVFFGVCVVAMTIFVWLFLPETKEIPIEDMGKVWRKHWWWRRYNTTDGKTLPI